MTETQKLGALSSAELSAEEIKTVVTTNALSTSENVATASTGGLSAAFKGLWVAIAPLAPALAILSALTAGIVIYSKIHPNLTKATKELKEQQEKFDSIKNEVDNLNTELDTAYKRISELQSLGSLSLIEDEELSKLQSSTSEMERQLAIKKEELRLEARETAKKADKAYDASFRSKYDENGELITGEGTKSNDPSQELANSIKAYYKTKQKYDEAIKNVDFFLNETEKNGGRYSATGQVSYSEYEKYQKQANSYKEQMNYAEKNANTIFAPIDAQKKAYEGLYQAGEELTVQQMDEYGVVKQSSDAYEKFCNNITDTQKAFAKLTVEQKRQSLENKMSLSGVSNSNAKDILDSYSDDDLDLLATIKFDPTSTKDSVAEQLSVAQAEIDSSSFNLSTTVSSLKEVYSLYSQFADKQSDNESFLFDLSEVEKLRETFKGTTEDFDTFEKVLTSSSSTANDVQTAFNTLTTKFLMSTSALDGLTTSTKEQIVSQLELQGITNASSIITDDLVKANEYLISQGSSLSQVTLEQANSFLQESNYSQSAKIALAEYALAKLGANNTVLNTDADIQNIIALISTLGGATTALKAYQNLKSGAVASTGSYYADNARLNAAKYSAEQEIQAGLDQAKKSQSTTVGMNASDAAKAGKEAGDAYVKSFEEAVSNLKDLQTQGKISPKQYLEQFRLLYQKFYGNIKKYAKNFADAQAEYIKGVASRFTGLFSAAISVIDKKIKSLQKEQASAVKPYEAAKKANDEEISSIESVNKEKQKQIDNINKANEARKRELDLQKAQYELQRAMNQKTTKVYTADGMKYQANTNDIAEKRENVDDINREKQIATIQNEIDANDERIDQLQEENERYDELIEKSNEYFEGLIEGLNETKDRWQELADLQSNGEMLSNLRDFGYTEADILSMTDAQFQQVKTSYANVLADMYSGNDTMKQSLSDISGIKLDGLNGYLADTADELARVQEIDLTNVSDSISGVTTSTDTLNESVGKVSSSLDGGGGGSDKKDKEGSESGGDKKKKDSGGGSGSLLGSLSNVTTTATSDEGVPSVTASFDELDIKLHTIIETLDLMSKKFTTVIEQANTLMNTKYDDNGFKLNGYAVGTKHAKKGLAFVAEEVPEIIRDKNGNISVATEPTLVNMQGGEEVISGAETEGILNNRLVSLSDYQQNLANGIKSNINFSDFSHGSALGGFNTPDYSNTLSNITTKNNNNQQSINIHQGAIVVQESKSPDITANAIMRSLHSIVNQETHMR